MNDGISLSPQCVPRLMCARVIAHMHVVEEAPCPTCARTFAFAQTLILTQVNEYTCTSARNHTLIHIHLYAPVHAGHVRIQDLVQKLLLLDPNARLGSDQLGGYAALKAHPFFNGMGKVQMCFCRLLCVHIHLVAYTRHNMAAAVNTHA